MKLRKKLLLALWALSAAACDGDAAPDGGLVLIDATTVRPDVGPPPEGATHFLVRVENVAGPALPSALGAGAWTLHTDADPLFTEGERDRGLGLEALAEDGDPSALAAHLDPGGTFRATAPGALTELIVTARPERPRLSLAAGLRESNDVIVATSGDGIALFDPEGQPLPARDVTAELHLFNVGTEIDQAPGLGPDQGARQAAPNTGAREGLPRPFSDSTRALPLARDLVAVEVSEAEGVFTIRLENVAVARRLLMTDLSAVLSVVHGERFALFERGAPASPGLEALAERGDPSALLAAARASDDVLAAEASERLAAGEVITITARPDRAHPRLTLATSVRETNDAFLAMLGVPLLDPSGAPRAPDAIALDVGRALAVWDAGTEANEAPGAGYNQAARQEAPTDGAPDPIAHVRRYDDTTNDLAGVGGGGYAAVQILHLGGREFSARILNTSGDTPNPGLISPTAWALHDGSLVLLSPTERVTRGMEGLAEDCHAGPLADELRAASGVIASGPLITPDGTDELRPLFDGQSYSVRVTADPVHRWLALITMPFPTNDALITVGTSGVALLDEAGRPRSNLLIAADVEALLRAWDAGTEANQAGAGGHDMSPQQESYNLGEPEGDGTVRRQADPVWSYPSVPELVRVTIEPLP